MFQFTGLKILHKDMQRVGERRTVFPFKYNDKDFSCIFLVDTTPFRLYLATLGLNPMVFELEIKTGYRVDSYLHDYKDLITYLGLKYDPHHIFKPNDLFAVLNRSIPPKFKTKPDYKYVLSVASKRRNIEEINKKYFCGWYSNPVGKKVRQENIEKTRCAFGDEKAKICEMNNISSCWTDVAVDENLTLLNKIYSK